MPITSRLTRHLNKTLLDKGAPSFGRTWSLPFLVSLWLISTAGGVVLLANGGDGIIEWMFAEAVIAAGLYGTSKGLSTLDSAVRGKYANVSGEVPRDDTEAITDS